MDLVKVAIPFSFVEAHLGTIGWADVLFGLDNGLLSPEAPGELALAELARDDEYSSNLIDLTLPQHEAEVRRLVAELAASDPREPDETRERWLYLVLAWLYERRTERADPLQDVELVYADFEYPERIAHLVRYMPASPTAHAAGESGEQYLFKSWAEFLANERVRLRAAEGARSP